MFLIPIILVFFSYLVGAIPTGYLICKLFFNLDITEHGSGNIGATNVARVLGNVRYFFLIFFIDLIKAFLVLCCADLIVVFYPNLLLSFAQQQILLMCTGALLLGNAFSVFLKFKGGKGVATTVGILLYLVPLNLIVLFIITWLLILGITRQVFLASVGSTFVLAALYGFLWSTTDALFPFFCLLFVWIVIRHKDNFRRYWRK